MCGRFTLQTPAETLQRLFGFAAPGPSWDPTRTDRPRYNIAPTQPILVARGRPGGRREGAWARWGMTAAKKRLAINARSETVFVRPAFRGPVRRGRVLVFADGFIEWKKAAGGERCPVHITRPDGAPFAMAAVGVEHRTADPAVEPTLSCAILTTRANPDVAGLHDRMPVLLDPAGIEMWLDPEVEAPPLLESLFEPPAEGSLRLTPVSSRVNKVDHDDPACLGPPDAPEAPADSAHAPKRAKKSGPRSAVREVRPDSRQLGFDFV